jgi:acetyl-CoA acetyltransferase
MGSHASSVSTDTLVGGWCFGGSHCHVTNGGAIATHAIGCTGALTVCMMHVSIASCLRSQQVS